MRSRHRRSSCASLWKRLCGPTTLLCNPTVVDDAGRFVGMPDLLEERTGLAGEFVGAVHRSRTQHRKDVARADRFRRVGLEPIEFVGADLARRAVWWNCASWPLASGPAAIPGSGWWPRRKARPSTTGSTCATSSQRGSRRTSSMSDQDLLSRTAVATDPGR